MRRTIVLMGALLLPVFGATSSAGACYNGMELEQNEDAIKTARAERLMRTGHLRRAFGLAGRTLRDVQRDQSRRAQNLRPRLERVLAVITVRLDGAVDRDRWRTPRQVAAAQRTANLEWARATLAQLARQGDDPILRAREAEALAQLGRHEEAARILEPLAEQDLMPDAWGYATLARVQDELGHRDQRDRAVRACNAMVARDMRSVCPAFGHS